MSILKKICVIWGLFFSTITHLVSQAPIQNHQLEEAPGSGEMLISDNNNIRAWNPMSAVPLSDFLNDLVLSDFYSFNDQQIPFGNPSGNLDQSSSLFYNPTQETLVANDVSIVDGLFIGGSLGTPLYGATGIQIGTSAGLNSITSGLRHYNSVSNPYWTIGEDSDDYGETYYDISNDVWRFKTYSTASQTWTNCFNITSDNQLIVGDNTGIIFAQPSGYPYALSDFGLITKDTRVSYFSEDVSIGYAVFDASELYTNFQDDWVFAFNSTTGKFEPGEAPGMVYKEIVASWNTNASYTLNLNSESLTNVEITLDDGMTGNDFLISNEPTVGAFNITFIADGTNTGDVDVVMSNSTLLATDGTTLEDLTLSAGDIINLNVIVIDGVNRVFYRSDESGGSGVNNVKEISTFNFGKYTLVGDDSEKWLRINSATAVNVIVPDDATNSMFEIGTQIDLEQMGAGTFSVTGQSSGVTINTANGNDSDGQYSLMTLKKVDTDVWTLVGGV